MYFYTNVHVNSNSAFIRGYKDGKRFEQRRDFSPYLFAPSQIPTGYRTLDGKYVKPLHFTDVKEARDFLKRYDEVANFTLYGSTLFTYQCIHDTFMEEVEYNVDDISVVSLDIETSTKNGFPNIALADKEVITLSM